MSTEPTTKDIGLRDISVADTNICLIDGTMGELSYRGYDIHDLAEYSTYEEVAYLLLNGDLPDSSHLDELHSTLASERELPQTSLTTSRRSRRHQPAMDVLQSTVALLAAFDPEHQTNRKRQTKGRQHVSSLNCRLSSRRGIEREET